ncbi:hypothetical protein OG21DRAFT_509256 [Imleria badia]|nr:hypothetical protein OG21DRAFT_509256 [Imleria badia]
MSYLRAMSASRRSSHVTLAHRVTESRDGVTRQRRLVCYTRQLELSFSEFVCRVCNIAAVLKFNSSLSHWPAAPQNMPPKRKRAEADTAATASTTRSTKKSSRTTREKNGAADATGKAGAANSVQPPSKKTKAKGKTSTAATKQTRGTKAPPQVLGIDDVS